MEITETTIAGVKVVTPLRHEDDRGFLSEVYHQETLAAKGITDEFVQENHTFTNLRGTIRGLHFQIPPRPTAKLVRVTRGSILDVAVDLRRASPTYGEHVSVTLSAENWCQAYVPEGFAHGFCTLEPNTDVAYRVSAYWTPDVDRGVLWNDPDLAIDWPVANGEALVSAKDRNQPRLADLRVYFPTCE